MGKIVLLDDATINKIAAGEVIERPASCVKEMCENSIDAGAKNITIEIKNGGISLIKIVDDGCGISEDDMEIAFERHATSKIRSAEDLIKVKTMGFRGEALASIAAIANIEMISKRPEDEVGHRIVVEGGKILEKSECGSPNGTTIIVKNLFFNTPVRYKFLKKDFTESGYIEDVITRLSLINKNISIKLINTGKTVIQTNGNNDIKDVVYSIYGKDVADGIKEVDYTYEDIHVSGVIGNTNISRSNRNGQLFFVNNRYVKDKTLTSAVDQAYKDILPVGKYGFAILNLEIDTSKVDCNVHPAKLEIRFEEEQKVFKAIYHAIKSKNNEIIENKNNKIEIQSQLESEQEETENIQMEKKEDAFDEDYKPREGTFSGFFKMLKNNKSKDEIEEKNTIIKDIFEAKKSGNLNWSSFDSNKSKIESNSADKKELNEENKKIEELEENIKKTDLEIQEELIDVKKRAEAILNKDKEERKSQEIKLGNTIISSDTQESSYNINDLLNANKQDTTKIDTTRIISTESSKTEIIDSLKKIDEVNKSETIILNTEAIRNEKIQDNNDDIKQDSTKNEIIEKDIVTERLLEQKANSDIDDTQLINTADVREKLRNNKNDEDTPITKDFANMYKKVFGMDVSTIRKTQEENNAKLDFTKNIQMVENEENQTIFDNKKEFSSIQYKFIGTIFDDYVIIEVKDEMYMIEIKAAEERLMYEVVKENYYNEEVHDSVALLLADIITLSAKEMSIARDFIEMFRKSGFDYEEFGEYTLKLTKVPSWAEKLNTKKLFLEILKELDTVAVTATKEKEEKFLATVSNKYVVLADNKLDEKGIEDLINRLLKLSSPFIYPNGKLTAVKISRANMEKKFSRR